MYVEELIRARKRFNISGARNREEFIKLIEESLAPLLIVDTWEDKVVLDVGSGAGFPGIPLAIVKGEAKFYLLDISQNRCAFLNLIKFKLNLNNVDVICEDVEVLKDNPAYHERFDMILSRAVGGINYLKPIVFPLLKRGGCLIIFAKEGQGYPVKSGLVLVREEKDE